MLPKFLRTCFWDVDLKSLDKNIHIRFIAERILELGDKEAVKWLIKNTPRKELIAVLHTSRQLSPKSANLWAMVFDVPFKEVRCLTRSFQNTYRKIWKN